MAKSVGFSESLHLPESEERRSTHFDGIPAGLNPALHEHYRQTHRKAETAAPSTPASTQSHFESMARAAASSVQSNVDRAETERLLTKAGAWGWELVYRGIEGFIQRRKQQRWLAGR